MGYLLNNWKGKQIMIHDTAGIYKYDAFISYSHIDRKTAVAIQHKLERYRIPKKIQEKRRKASLHLKVFRDESDLSAGNLREKLDDALDMSAKLIVICSSAPAIEGADKYKWVTREVQHFIDNGRINDILPLVFDDGKDCLPQNIVPLLDTLFISNVPKLGKRKAFLKVLSAVLNTDFDALIKRNSIRRCGWAVALLAVFLIIAKYVNYYYMPHTTYYEDYVMRNGIPKGVRALGYADRSERSDIYAITIKRSKHKLYLKHVNSAGLLIEDKSVNHIEPPAAAVYHCLDDWTIDTVDYLDENEKQICTYTYAPDLSYVDLIKSRDDATWLTTSAGTNEYNLPTRTNISRYRLEFNEDGSLFRRMYAVDRLNALDEEGVAGEEYTYSPSSGKLTQIIYLNVDGTPMANKHGIAGVKLYYNSNGLNYRLEYFDADGALIENDQWYAGIEKEYDTNFNVSEIHYYDSDNHLVVISDGYAIEKINRNKRGFITSQAYFDAENNKVFHSLGCHEINFKRDSLGRETAVSYFDTDNRLVLISSKYAKRVTKYNRAGLVKEQSYYGVDNEPFLCDIGAYKSKCKYDKNDNLIKISYYDTNNEPVYTSFGYVSICLKYNDMGMEESQSYFGVNDEPILGKDGYHKQTFVYKDRYNIEEIQYTGILGQPTLCSSGYAFRKLKYDDAGNIVEDFYLDDYEQPTYRTGYYAKILMHYNKRGNRESIEYYNLDDSSADNTPFFKVEYIYDDSTGRVEEEHYYRGNTLFKKQNYEYIRGGVVSSKTVSSGDTGSESATSYTYDKRGNELEVIKSKNSTVTSKTVREFDERNNIVKEFSYGSEDKLIKYYTVDFNHNGMPTKTCYYNSEGQLSRNANNGEHVAIVEADYNSRNQKIERRCYDEHGNRLRINQFGQEGYAILKMNYSKNRIESIFYDDTEEIYQIVVQEYDDYDHEINRIYYDGNNNQLVRHECSYNVHGKLLSDALYDSKDKLFAAPSSGVAKIQYNYDQYDYMIGEEFYDADSKLVAPYGLYAKYESARKNGRTTRIDYYGTSGELVKNSDGYATETFTYDDRGNETGRSFYDTNGNPVLLKWGFSRYEITYDEYGNIKDSKFFDIDNHEVKQVDGEISLEQVLLNNVPQRILMFNGNDGSTLMGQIEMKLKIILHEQEAAVAIAKR